MPYTTKYLCAARVKKPNFHPREKSKKDFTASRPASQIKVWSARNPQMKKQKWGLPPRGTDRLKPFSLQIISAKADQKHFTTSTAHTNASMKKIFYSALLAGLFLTNNTTFSQTEQNARQADGAEWTAGIHLREALNNTLAKAIIVNHQTDFKFREGTAFLATSLDKGQNISYPLQLKAYHKYAFIGGGDRNLKNCKLYLQKDGKTYAKDTEEDETALIAFTPLESGNYQLICEFADGASTQSFIALALMVEKVGYDISAEDLDEAINRIINFGSLIDRQFGAKIYNQSNQWSLYGTLLSSGTKITIGQLNGGSGKHYAIAAGPSRLIDADLQITDQLSGKILKEDRKNDATPAVDFSTQRNKTYQLTVVNVKSNGPSVIITLLLDD